MPKVKMDAKALAVANAKDNFLADIVTDWLKHRLSESAKVAGIADVAKAHTFIAGNRGKAEYILDEIRTRIASRSVDKPNVSKKAILFGPASE